jgi:hypothetical protein
MATYLRHVRLPILVTLHEVTARISPIIRSQLPMLTPVRRRADYPFGRGRTSVGAARRCGLPHYVLPLGYEHYDARVGCLAQSPIATLARPDFRPGVLADPRCLASRDQVGTRETSRHDQLQGPTLRFALRPGPPRLFGHGAGCVSSRSRVRSCDASG